MVIFEFDTFFWSIYCGGSLINFQPCKGHFSITFEPKIGCDFGKNENKLIWRKGKLMHHYPDKWTKNGVEIEANLLAYLENCPQKMHKSARRGFG